MARRHRAIGDLTCNARFTATTAFNPATFPTTLDQVAISGPGLRMFIAETQQYKADNRHQYINWENQSHVSRGKIARCDHLVNVAAGRAK